MFINYNANPSGKATGDSVIRAISTVTGLPWRTVHWDLAQLSNERYQMSDEQFQQFSNLANQIIPFIRR